MSDLTIHQLAEESAKLDAQVVGREIDWRHGALGIFIELGETINNLPWRPWRVEDQRQPTRLELAMAADEFADAIGTIVRVAIQLGITPTLLDQAVSDYVVRKYDRLRTGIDG